jgi:hypothetical protein
LFSQKAAVICAKVNVTKREEKQNTLVDTVSIHVCDTCFLKYSYRDGNNSLFFFFVLSATRCNIQRAVCRRAYFFTRNFTTTALRPLRALLYVPYALTVFVRKPCDSASPLRATQCVVYCCVTRVLCNAVRWTYRVGRKVKNSKIYRNRMPSFGRVRHTRHNRILYSRYAERWSHTRHHTHTCKRQRTQYPSPVFIYLYLKWNQVHIFFFWRNCHKYSKLLKRVIFKFKIIFY